MKTPKVIPVKSTAGNFLKNQYIIQTEKGEFFQSYNKVIAFMPKYGIACTIVDLEKMKFSKSTQNQTENFLAMNLQQVEHLISTGLILNQKFD